MRWKKIAQTEWERKQGNYLLHVSQGYIHFHWSTYYVNQDLKQEWVGSGGVSSASEAKKTAEKAADEHASKTYV